MCGEYIHLKALSFIIPIALGNRAASKDSVDANQASETCLLAGAIGPYGKVKWQEPRGGLAVRSKVAGLESNRSKKTPLTVFITPACQHHDCIVGTIEFALKEQRHRRGVPTSVPPDQLVQRSPNTLFCI